MNPYLSYFSTLYGPPIILHA